MADGGGYEWEEAACGADAHGLYPLCAGGWVGLDHGADICDPEGHWAWLAGGAGDHAVWWAWEFPLLECGDEYWLSGLGSDGCSAGFIAWNE